MPSDLELLVTAAREAGKIARGFFKSDPKVWEKSNNAGPVTEADLAVNQMLERTLPAARPDYGWLSEETEDDTSRRNKPRVFVIDPIDGTRAFIAGSDTWAHSLAVVEDGRPVAAVVYLPVLDKMYTASRDVPAKLNGQEITVSGRTEISGATVLAAKPNFDQHHWRGDVPDVEPAFRSSLAYRMALVAEGRFDAMLTLRPTWEWDVAAGSLLVTQAGGAVTGRHNEEPVFNNAMPQLSGMVAAGPPVHKELIKALA
ncbi:inositol monophosphatase family protein [Nereida ignava]|uniref:inositol monophosphatase family protein n=1 Tax=Nereida ignava TaxID=282199 RepID=UPI003F6C39B7